MHSNRAVSGGVHDHAALVLLHRDVGGIRGSGKGLLRLTHRVRALRAEGLLRDPVHLLRHGFGGGFRRGALGCTGRRARRGEGRGVRVECVGGGRGRVGGAGALGGVEAEGAQSEDAEDGAYRGDAFEMGPGRRHIYSVR